MFKKKKTKTYLKDISIQHIATGQLGAYIINELYRTECFNYIGYEVYKSGNGELRCKIYTLPRTKNRAINYFNDRCSGCIEEKIKQLEGIAHSWEKYGEYEYVVRYRIK